MDRSEQQPSHTNSIPPPSVAAPRPPQQVDPHADPPPARQPSVPAAAPALAPTAAVDRAAVNPAATAGAGESSSAERLDTKQAEALARVAALAADRPERTDASRAVVVTVVALCFLAGSMAVLAMVLH